MLIPSFYIPLTDAVEARCSLRPSEPTGCSTSYDSNTFSYEHAVCERRWGSTQGQQQQGPANPAHPPGPEQHDKSKLTDAMDLSRGLLQQVRRKQGICVCRGFTEQGGGGGFQGKKSGT
eukprot:1161449-Pelagomonas_calceolata.AAC.3